MDSGHVSDMSAMIAAHQEGGGGGEAEFRRGTTSPVHLSPPSVYNFSLDHQVIVRRGLQVISDVDVSDVCRGAGQVHVLVHTFGFCCAAELLSLPQAGLQQGLYLLLARPQAVLQA